MATKPGTARTNEPARRRATIVLQVGTELRITNKGEIILSNPELELSREKSAADATLLYKFDAEQRRAQLPPGRPLGRPQAHEDAQARRLTRRARSESSNSSSARAATT